MPTSKEVRYKDLVQLVVFPDGSPLSSRLKNAALLQVLFGESQKTHDKAVATGKRINGQVPHWIRQQLDLLHQGRPSWVPQFKHTTSTAPVQAWMSRATRQLELLLHDGLENLVGFRGELKVETTAFKPVYKQRGWTGVKTMPKQLVSCTIILEDASGEPQGKAVPMDINTGSGYNHRCILEVNSEDCIMRLQVYEHAQEGLPTKHLVGELRVPLTSLPSIGAETELALPMYRHRLYQPDAPVPVYKAHREQLVTPLAEDYVHVGDVQCIITYTTDAPQAKPHQLAPTASLRSSSADAMTAIVSAVTNLGRISSIDRPAWNPTNWTEASRREQARAAVRARWVNAVNKVIAEIVVKDLRQNKNEEVLKAMSHSPVFGSDDVEVVFYELMNKVWDKWSKHMNKSQTHHTPRNTPRTRSLDTLPTMISASLGSVDQQQQPLYYILAQYDRNLRDVMKDPGLVNEYIPGMPFFHIIFIYAMLRGISPWLMKMCMVRHILKSLQPNSPEVSTVTYTALKFIVDVMSEVEVARRQQLLTDFESNVHSHVTKIWNDALPDLLRRHYDVIPPEDAAARKLVLDRVAQIIPPLQLAEEVINILNSLATKRMREQLKSCDVHTIEHAISIFRDSKSYEAVRQCCSVLSKAWSESARDFEACLSLKKEAKDLLRYWEIEPVILKHYEHLKRAATALIHDSPFWPYNPKLGYDMEDLQRLQDGVEDANAVLREYALVKPQDIHKSGSNPHLETQLSNGSTVAQQNPQIPAAGLPTCMYEVQVFTGTLRGAGTESQVFIDIRGNVKSSGKHALTPERSKRRVTSRLFQSGSKDVFILPIRGGNLGALTEIELSTDGVGSGHSWYVDRVQIVDLGSKQEYFFDCQAWLSNTRPGCTLEKVFAVTLEPPTAMKTTYLVEVMTANQEGAGTDSNVYIQLFGSVGQMDTVQYLKRKRKTDFDQNQHSQFSISCGYIGNIERICLGIQPQAGVQQSCLRTGKKKGDKWCVDHLIITNTKNDAKWLFKPENGGWFTHRQPQQTLKPCEETQYRVMVRTADEHGASLERGQVWVVLSGTAGSSGTLVLTDPVAVDGHKQNTLPFQRGQEDFFSVYWEDLGELRTLTLGHDGKSIRSMLGFGRKTDWRVDEVKVVDVTHSQKYIFPGCELSEKNPRRTVPCKTKLGTQVKKIVTYKIWVYTTNIARAGTDAHVYLEMFGESYSRSGKRQLVDRSRLNLFEMGQIDEFVIQSDDLGTLEKLEISHDNSGLGASWHLDKVEVLDTRANRKYVFPCRDWLNQKNGARKMLYPEVASSSRAPGPPYAQYQPGGPSSSTAAPPPTTDYKLELLDWTELMRSQVDRQISHVNTTRDRIASIPTDGASTSHHNSSDEWKPVSERNRHALEKVELTRGVTHLIDIMSNDVVRNITHSRLRAEVAQRVLLKVIQPAATQVMKHLQHACLQELQQARLPGSQAANKVTIFELDDKDLEALCLRINTLIHHSITVHEKLEQFGLEASGGRLRPADRRVIQQETERVLHESRSRAGSVLAELRSAMRYSFSVALEALTQAWYRNRDALEDRLLKFVTDDSLKSLSQFWLLTPDAIKLLYNLYWSSLLEAVQCQMLGLSIWTLGIGFKLTTDQAITIEGALKTAELILTDEEMQLSSHETFKWTPQQSLIDVGYDNSEPYLRHLLQASQDSSETLYNTMLERSRELRLEASGFETQHNIPYFGTEVVSSYFDLQNAQPPVHRTLCILDYARLLRSRARDRSSTDYSAHVEQHLRSLHDGHQIQVLFGLPSHERQSGSYSIHLTHKHPEAQTHNRTQVQVNGQLYIFTSYVAFTTLVQLSHSAQATHVMQGVPKEVLTYSDYTVLWTATQDILHTEILTSSNKLIMTLVDHSVVEMSLLSKADVEGLKDCYRKICLAKGVAADALPEPPNFERRSAPNWAGRR